MNLDTFITQVFKYVNGEPPRFDSVLKLNLNLDDSSWNFRAWFDSG